MTGREINLLQPGDYLINPSGEIYRFIGVQSYRRNKADSHTIQSLPQGSKMCITRYELSKWWQTVPADDSRVKTIEVLFGAS